MGVFNQTQATKAFQCLGDACEDTCCKGWGMQLSAQTVEKYEAEAPELLDAVSSGEAEFIMKRDPQTDYCVKFDAGWCGVHKTYGDSFLGDACHFFPRATRQLAQDITLMTVAPSCPEALRRMLYDTTPFALTTREDIRVPHSVKTYTHGSLTSEAMLTIHQQFLDYAGDEAASPALQLMRMAEAVRGLAHIAAEQWPEAVGFYLKMADGRLPAAEPHPADFIRLLNALQGLIGASKATHRPRLMQTVETIAQALHVTLDWQTLTVAAAPDTIARQQEMQDAWDGYYGAQLEAVLRRYLQAQLSLGCFPFSGLGATAEERSLILALRFATAKLALMAECFIAEEVPSSETVVRILQSLSRFLDHLADPTFSLSIYKEVGWNQPARLRALLGC